MYKIERPLEDTLHHFLFDTVVEERLPFEEKEVVLGTLKILRNFSSQKDKHVIGGRVETGKIANNSVVKIVRRGVELGRALLLLISR